MAESTKSKAEKNKNKSSSKKSKDGAGENRKNGDKGSESQSGTDAAAILSKAKVPAAATGAVLLGAAGAATLKKNSGTRKKSGSRKGKLLRKAAKTSNPVLTAAGSQARKLKKLMPGS